jgi:acetyl-CoA carboxylase biotin carboxyl carrier protein
MVTPDEPVPSLLDPALIRDVLGQLAGTAIDELEVSDGSSRLYIRREPGDRHESGGAERDDEALTGSAVSAITAPLTGVYYARPAPDQPVFVSEGSVVLVDDVVGLIETMKLFNEVTAEISGRVTEIVALDGDLVEAGHALMFVAPLEEET